jgi:hypothetical protein
MENEIISNYCQYLIITQNNYTITYLADHLKRFSHDKINRHLKKEKLKPSQIWENVFDKIIFSENGYLIFDDSVLDKKYSNEIDLAIKQWSGNEHKIIKGIGCVNLVYYNPDINKFWVVDYRIWDPNSDGKTKIDHVKEMLNSAFYTKKIVFKAVSYHLSV